MARGFHQRFTFRGLDDAFAPLVYKYNSDHAAETSMNGASHDRRPLSRWESRAPQNRRARPH